MANPVVPAQWEETKTAAVALNVGAELLDVRSGVDIEPAIKKAAEAGIEALVVGPDAVTQANRKRIIEAAIAHRVATIYPSREFVDEGGLVSYGVSYPHLYWRAAGLIDAVLKGTKPSDLPVQQPAKFEFVINLKAAANIGMAVPPP